MNGIQDLINASVREERAAKEQRHWFISRLGQCPTGQYLERAGFKPDKPFDDRTLRVFNVGNVFEDWIVKLLAKQDKFVLELQVPVEDQVRDISGKADFILTTNEIPIVYELKTVHSGAFWWMFKGGMKYGKHYEPSGPKPQHIIQLWWYLKLLNIPMGVLMYISKDDLTIKECPVLLNNIDIEKEAEETLAILNEAWRTKTPPPPITDPEDPRTAWHGKYCPYHLQCMQYAEAMEITA